MPSMIEIRLTAVERDHLLTLARDAQDRGDYYGPKDVYWRRHVRIIDKLERANGG